MHREFRLGLSLNSVQVFRYTYNLKPFSGFKPGLKPGLKLCVRTGLSLFKEKIS